MAEFSIDRFVDLYAERASGMSASEVRALFAVASRPEIVSFAGGMPYVQALPPADVLAVVADALDVHGSTILQYAGGQGHLSLRERLITLMTDEGVDADPDDMVITTGAQQALDLIGKIFIDPGDLIAVEAPAYVGALTAFGAYQPRYLQIDLDPDGMIVDQLEEALVRGERPKFVYTVPNFGNPAGVTGRQPRRASVRSVDMQPQPPAFSEVGELSHEVDRAGVRRARDRREGKAGKARHERAGENRQAEQKVGRQVRHGPTPVGDLIVWQGRLRRLDCGRACRRFIVERSERGRFRAC
jgi:hypothetical protein